MEARSDKIRVMKPDQKVCTKGRPDDSFLVSYITVSLPSLLNYAYIHIRFLLYSIHQEGPFFHFLVNRSALPSLPSPFTLTARNIVPTLLCLPGTREMKPNIRITMRRKKNKKSKGRIAATASISFVIYSGNNHFGQSGLHSHQKQGSFFSLFTAYSVSQTLTLLLYVASRFDMCTK